MRQNRIFLALCALAFLVFCMCCMSIAGFAAEDPVLQAGQWECNSSVMTGEYSDLSDWPSDLTSVDLYFTSGGLGYMSLSYGYDLQTSKGNCLYYGDTLVYSFGPVDPGWIQDAYAQIYFDADQEVSQAFYDWFTANFSYVGSDYVEPSFSTTINIYDTTGTSLLTSYSLTGERLSPAVNGLILADGLSLTDASGHAWSWSDAGDPFYGFALHPNFTLVAYDAGETFVAGGLSSDYTLDLYLVTSLPSENSEYQDGVLGWLQSLFDQIGDGLQRIVDALAPSEGEKFLGIIDFKAIGDFFSDAYDGVRSVFGLRDLIDDDTGPFAWLEG